MREMLSSGLLASCLRVAAKSAAHAHDHAKPLRPAPPLACPSTPPFARRQPASAPDTCSQPYRVPGSLPPRTPLLPRGAGLLVMRVKVTCMAGRVNEQVPASQISQSHLLSNTRPTEQIGIPLFSSSRRPLDECKEMVSPPAVRADTAPPLRPAR